MGADAAKPRRGLPRPYNKDHQRSHLDEALDAIDGALEEYRKANAAFYIDNTERLRQKVFAAKANRTPPRQPVPK
jgi:hypothetical protein